MRRLETRMDGLVLIEPNVHADERGFFVETYQRDLFGSLGIQIDFVQDNHSRSRLGTVRGLHFQMEPGQAKLVRCARGAIRDVVVDLRRSSATYGKHETYDLDDAAHRQLYIPVGFAHGFAVLTDIADVVYKVSSVYDAQAEAGIAWDDPELGVTWGVLDPIVSERDRRNPTLREIAPRLPAW
jgi:dTDP-4-dehydrorhamnose 3,5-epimerase